MDRLDAMIKRMQDFDMGEAVNSAVKKNELKVLELNTGSQLYNKGIGSDSKTLNPGYSKPYAARKRRMGLPSNRITLYLSGSLHSGIKITYGKGFISFGAPGYTTKTGFPLPEHLKKRYGKMIFGLTGKNIKATGQMIKPEIFKSIKKVLS
jgi:hypothetical protein